MRESQEPQLLRQLREKALQLQFQLDKVTSLKKQNTSSLSTIANEYQSFLSEKEVQTRKYKSLIVLLNQLQRNYHQVYLEQKNISSIDEKTLSHENFFLRNLLIRESQNLKQMQKLANFLKHLEMNKNSFKTKTKDFIKKNNFIESQAEAIAKMKAQLNLLRNQNLECKRKWFMLDEENRKLESDQKLYKIQVERQKTEIKEQYENYLERINESKTKIVHFNETQRQNLITDYFVQEIAVLQQKRVQIQETNHNLIFHLENLHEESEKIAMENKQLLSFFYIDGEEGKLAMKMKKRIDELRDTLIEMKKKNKNSRINKLTNMLDYLRMELNRIQQSNDFMEMRIKEQEDKGICLQENPISQFFTSILTEKDKQLIMLRQQQNSLHDKKKELEVSKELLKSQIANLSENLAFNSYENQYRDGAIWSQNLY